MHIHLYNCNMHKPYSMTWSTCNIGNIDKRWTIVKGNTIVTCCSIEIPKESYLISTYITNSWWFIRLLNKIKADMHKRELRLPVSIIESWILTLDETEMSMPSVLGLFWGARIWRLEMVTLLLCVILIWPFGLSTCVSPLNSRLLHLKKCRACNVYTITI